MNLKSALIGTSCCVLLAGFANGQTIRQPQHVRSVALASDYYAQDTEASPSDLPQVAEPQMSSGSSIQSSKGGDCGCVEACCCDSEIVRWFPEIGCGWTLTGWLDMGATANADRPNSRINGPVTFNDRSNFQFNQFYLSFGRDADTGGCGFAWGGRVDMLYGTDYIFTQAAGLELHDNGARHWNRRGNQYGLAMPQAYAEIGYNDFALKLGHFYTIIGNETVTAPNNFFYSHAYTMQYGEPFTHTGALLSWDYSDTLDIHGGVVNGWDKFDAETDRLSFLGGITYTPCDRPYSIAIGLIIGEEDGIAPPIAGTRTMYSIVFNYEVSDSLTYILQHDNGWQEVAPGVDNEWYGINQYLLYTINDCWKAGVRFEWFRDDDGSRLQAAPVRNGGLAGLGIGGLNQADFAGNYYNISCGLNWTPTTNLVVRPEVRWDWSDGTAIRPYDDLNKDSQMTAAFDAILHF